jgi:hypothetical protein
MKDFELLEKRAQELIDECPDPLEVAMTAVRAIDSYATQAVVMTRLLMAPRSRVLALHGKEYVLHLETHNDERRNNRHEM